MSGSCESRKTRWVDTDGLLVASTMLRQSFFRVELHQMRDPELTLGGASAQVWDQKGKGGKSWNDAHGVTSTAPLVSGSCNCCVLLPLPSSVPGSAKLPAPKPLPGGLRLTVSPSSWDPIIEFPGLLFSRPLASLALRLAHPVSPFLFLPVWTTAPGLWALSCPTPGHCRLWPPPSLWHVGLLFHFPHLL